MISKSIQDTENIAKSFLDKVLKNKKPREGALVICLSGELGAGKTAFTKIVSKVLGIKHKVNSPTFVVMKKYSIGKTYGVKFLLHFDAYRLNNGAELLSLGWEEMIKDKNNLIIIEWPENVKDIIPHDALYINILSDENGVRNFEFK
ncbi:MAG: tRNA (adenosine(37)-N6)-threonylcarbamoyltransferase complex ATPase subunit type 1 TsaE [Patescibacteria group bacterium]